MDITGYEKSWYKVIFKRVFTLSTFKALILIVIIVISGIILAGGKVPLNPENLQTWIAEKGLWGPIILVSINNVAIFNPFIPNQLIHITAGALYGPILAFMLIYPASLAGWSLNYYLGKKLGRNFVGDMIGADNLAKVDGFVKKAKFRDFIVLIFTPGMSYDTLAYIAGVVNADFKAFFLGGAIGSIVPTGISIWIGSITIDQPWIGITLTVIGIIASMIYGYSVIKRKSPVEKA